MKGNQACNNFQKGMATLTVTVVILVIVTLMVFFATKVGILDQRMAGNEVRYKEAFAQAEAGLDFVTQRFNSQFKLIYDGDNAATSLATIIDNSTGARDCDGIDQPGDNDFLATDNDLLDDLTIKPDGTCAASGEGYFTVCVDNDSDPCDIDGIDDPATDPNDTPLGNFGSIPVILFQSTGTGADGTGTATIQRQISMSGVLGGDAPDIPVIVGGSVGTGGDFNIVGNPNGGGPGIPVSVWTGPESSGNNIEMSGSSATCHIQFYDGNNPQCSNPSGNSELLSKGDGTPISSYTPSKPDLLPNDPNFPTDLFAFVFGLPRADWLTKKNEAAMNGQVVGNCSSIVSQGVNAGVNFPLWWITGDCDIGSNKTIGTIDKPVILVVDDSEFSMSAGTVVHGIVFIFDNPDNVATPSADMNGSPELHGSFISDVGGAAMSGSYSVIYDPNVVHSFDHGGGSNYTIAYIPGSWRDFQ